MASPNAHSQEMAELRPPNWAPALGWMCPLQNPSVANGMVVEGVAFEAVRP